MINLLGYLGMFFVILSFLFKKLTVLRLLNIIGGTLSCIYGFLIVSYPTALLNLCLVIINIFMLLSNRINFKKVFNKLEEASEAEANAVRESLGYKNK